METNGIPHIDRIQPAAGIPGGDVTIYGAGFVPRPNTRPHVRFGETEASVLISTQNYLIARVPEGAAGSIVSVETSRAASQPSRFTWACRLPTIFTPWQTPRWTPKETFTSPTAAIADKKLLSRFIKSRRITR